MEIIIKPSHVKNKKNAAVINNIKTIPFGQAGASDFTKHKNEDRKQRYLARHKKYNNIYILHYIQMILYGINQRLQKVLKTLTKGSKILA